MKKQSIFLSFLLLVFSVFLSHAAVARAVPNLPADLQSSPQKVHVGFYLNRVVNLDLKQNTYWMDFYIWFRWKGPIDPTETYEIMNAYEKWGSTIVAENEEVRILPDGYKYKELHMEYELHCPLNFSSYPLDEQTLTIQLEDKSHPEKVIQYIPDTIDSKVSPELFIQGWKPIRFDVIGSSHLYDTRFGQPAMKKNTYSRVSFRLFISRHPRHLHLFKLFLPVLIILVMVGVIFFIPISFFESRVEIAVTGLLSLIALQMVLNETLPPVGYLTLTDRVYYLAYFSVMCALIETVWVYFSFKRDVRQSRRIDRRSAMVMLFLMPVLLVLFFTVWRG
ncbi:hypothetical protein COW36_14945 [bacterium (Candidatus Blackallbacteria) CG17_big_fil_post_rev_8_21_14_2_50_48_46]|uniref:Neurotransmitter-gated ion-channel ligand-binding domain-containing protein n=1 Tax=bacterium (Candidatus Blackallbacteria) CG17_big_fil_post_rev_8_21_14_2_50_48_46 TaxID=2014261 RepID=A0A2M7G2I9_9BACT|nr:MAG: hypothetical protein COW64_11605 [bacterium (Candidatus Blackallbacteria) CG18_big_fil_WC_8_21_14_2_50_49_26]PIW16008.1 MAG: hypothetical protein COW36_14945 [bacterium (Candidatus Blackallbacteria) CG17_big_fil_post_rev_8_21_14_2_50_48_46]PIW50420.1 MAG: hypothetical protein COW20_02660 [bacterium (Candidatus Blackallbacteria) CG13_big_fil_rev_8_21_14_2_50_49_14]